LPCHYAWNRFRANVSSGYKCSLLLTAISSLRPAPVTRYAPKSGSVSTVVLCCEVLAVPSFRIVVLLFCLCRFPPATRRRAPAASASRPRRHPARSPITSGDGPRRRSSHCSIPCADGSGSGDMGAWSLCSRPNPWVARIPSHQRRRRPTHPLRLLVGDVWFASGQSNMEMPCEGSGQRGSERRGQGIAPRRIQSCACCSWTTRLPTTAERRAQ